MDQPAPAPSSNEDEEIPPAAGNAQALPGRALGGSGEEEGGEVGVVLAAAALGFPPVAARGREEGVYGLATHMLNKSLLL
jgi:hypothetical protein